MTMKNSWLDFAALCRLWAPGLTRRITRVILRRENGNISVHAAAVQFDNGKFFHANAEFQLETDSFFAVLAIDHLTPEAFTAYIDEIAAEPSKLLFGDYEFLLPGSKSDPSIYFNPLYEPRFKGPLRLPSATVTSSSSSGLVNLDSELNEAALFTSNPPFLGIEDLMAHLGFPKEVLQGTWTPNIRYTAAAPIGLAPETTFSGSYLDALVTIPNGFDISCFQARLVAHPRGGPPDRRMIDSPSTLTETRLREVALKYRVELHSMIGAQLLIFYKNEHMASFPIPHETNRPNLISQAHQHFHSRIDPVELMNSPGKINATLFETLVSLAITQVGIKTLFYGGTKEFSDAPDIIAVTDRNDLILVEVTTGHPDNGGKLMDLSKRLLSVVRYAADGGMNARSIRAALFTNLKSNLIESARLQATDLGIALFCREELEDFFSFSRTREAAGADEFMNLFDEKLKRKNVSLAGPQTK